MIKIQDKKKNMKKLTFTEYKSYLNKNLIEWCIVSMEFFF